MLWTLAARTAHVLFLSQVSAVSGLCIWWHISPACHGLKSCLASPSGAQGWVGFLHGAASGREKVDGWAVSCDSALRSKNLLVMGSSSQLVCMPQENIGSKYLLEKINSLGIQWQQLSAKSCLRKVGQATKTMKKNTNIYASINLVLLCLKHNQYKVHVCNQYDRGCWNKNAKLLHSNVRL